MTRQRRWPDHADEHRQTAIRRAREILELSRDAQRHLDGGNRFIVLVNLSEIKMKAKDIELEMVLAKEGR